MKIKLQYDFRDVNWYFIFKNESRFIIYFYKFDFYFLCIFFNFFFSFYFLVMCNHWSVSVFVLFCYNHVGNTYRCTTFFFFFVRRLFNSLCTTWIQSWALHDLFYPEEEWVFGIRILRTNLGPVWFVQTGPDPIRDLELGIGPSWSWRPVFLA